MAAEGIGMAISSDITSYFAKQHMVEYVATLGGHQAAIGTIKQYYIDLATYTGVIGFLGSMIAMIAPSIILKGQASAAIAGISSLNGSYKGGPEEAQNILADGETKNKAYEAEKEEIARGRLSKMGKLGDIPTNMSAGDYYNKVLSGAASEGGKWGNFNAGHRDGSNGEGLIDNVAKGNSYIAEQNMAKMNEFASRIDSAGGGVVANNSGRIQGAMQASSIEADSAEIGDIDAIHSGSKKQAMKKLKSTAGYDGEVTESQAENAGLSEGISAGAKDATIGKDSKLEAHARVSGTDAGLKQIEGAEGLLESKAYNDDGSANEGQEGKKYRQGLINQSRIAANKIQGVGKIGKLSEDDMLKLQQNEETATLGGIRATNAEIKKHHGVDGAIKDMVSLAQGKGIQTASDAKTLRKNYGNANGSDLTKEAKLLSDKDKKTAEKDLAKAKAVLAPLEEKKENKKKDQQAVASLNDKRTAVVADIGLPIAKRLHKFKDISERNAVLENSLKSDKDNLSKEESAQYKDAKKLKEASIATLKHSNDGMTLREVSENISDSKLKSQLGQAEGVKNNIETGVNYAQNSMYGEESKQRSTAAKIKKQGGVEGAVTTDAKEAGFKAAQQLGSVAGTEEGANKIAKAGESISDALERVAKDLAAGKINKDQGTIDGAGGSANYRKKSYEGGIESGSGMATRYESASNTGASTPEEVAKRLHTSGRLKDVKQNAPYDAAAALIDGANISPKMADMGMQVLSTIGTGAFANHLVGNPVGKLGKWAAKKSPFYKKEGKEEASYYSSNHQYGQPNNSVNNHNKSFSPEMNNYNEKNKNSEAGYEKEAINRERLESDKAQNKKELAKLEAKRGLAVSDDDKEKLDTKE